MSIATITKEYTFTNGTEIADANKVNTNFDDIYTVTNEVIGVVNSHITKLGDINPSPGELVGHLTGTLTGNVVGTVSNTPPPGAVIYFAMQAAPTGWLACSGQAVSRATYANLFIAIGTTFGIGDGVATFTLPDLRGEFIRGWDNSRGVDSGRTFGSAQSDLIKEHTHTSTLKLDGDSGATTPGGSPERGSGGSAGTLLTDEGLTTGVETRPRNIALLACIKY